MPFGLEGLALVPMGWGISAVIAIAETVAAWPSAVRLVPAMPAAFLALTAAGGLWLCLWRGWLRLPGLAFLAAAAAIGIRERPPDILAGLDPGAFAVRVEGGLAIAPATRRFTREYWLRSAGQAAPAAWPDGRTLPDSMLACDGIGCILRRSDGPVAIAFDRAALQEDCHAAEMIVAAVPVSRRKCPAPGRIIDLRERRREGAVAIGFGPDGPRMQSARALRGERPWVAQYRRKRATSRP